MVKADSDTQQATERGTDDRLDSAGKRALDNRQLGLVESAPWNWIAGRQVLLSFRKRQLSLKIPSNLGLLRRAGIGISKSTTSVTSILEPLPPRLKNVNLKSIAN